jgi:phage/plasmid-like protein (TIGR03299 family)
MAHEFETGFFVKQPAWHGLGTVLEAPPTVEAALTHAGLDWTVRLEQLGRMVSQPIGMGLIPPPVFTPANRWAVIRESDDTELGTVGASWRPLQNKVAFTWFQPIVDAGLATLEAAGALRNGSRVWVLAKVVGPADEIVDGDKVERYILLAHGHDGLLAIRCGLTGIRVVCQNTLSAAINAETLVRILHHAKAEETLAAAREVVTRANGAFDKAAEIYRALAKVKNVTARQLRAYCDAVFPKPEGPKGGGDGGGSGPADGGEPESKSRIFDQVSALYEAGAGTDIPGVRGTAWGAYNAMTEFLTHERGRSQDRRVENSFFGPEGARALSAAVDVFKPQVEGAGIIDAAA